MYQQMSFLRSLPWSVLFVVITWNVYWKGRALWAASKNNQKYWFVALLILNTLGILEIIYLQFFKKKSSKQ